MHFGDKVREAIRSYSDTEDKLFKNGATLFYSGDFDPEGLLIADKLKIRYKNKLVLWR